MKRGWIDAEQRREHLIYQALEDGATLAEAVEVVRAAELLIADGPVRNMIEDGSVRVKIAGPECKFDTIINPPVSAQLLADTDRVMAEVIGPAEQNTPESAVTSEDLSPERLEDNPGLSPDIPTATEKREEHPDAGRDPDEGCPTASDPAPDAMDERERPDFSFPDLTAGERDLLAVLLRQRNTGERISLLDASLAEPDLAYVSLKTHWKNLKIKGYGKTEGKGRYARLVLLRNLDGKELPPLPARKPGPVQPVVAGSPAPAKPAPARPEFAAKNCPVVPSNPATAGLAAIWLRKQGHDVEKLRNGKWKIGTAGKHRSDDSLINEVNRQREEIGLAPMGESKSEDELVAEAVAAGRVTRLPAGQAAGISQLEQSTGVSAAAPQPVDENGNSKSKQIAIKRNRKRAEQLRRIAR